MHSAENEPLMMHVILNKIQRLKFAQHYSFTNLITFCFVVYCSLPASGFDALPAWTAHEYTGIFIWRYSGFYTAFTAFYFLLFKCNWKADINGTGSRCRLNL